MSDPTSPSVFFEPRTVIGHRVALQALLWSLASLSLAGLVLILALAVSAQNDREAGRMMIEAQKGVGPIAMLTGSLAASQGRPRGF